MRCVADGEQVRLERMGILEAASRHGRELGRAGEVERRLPLVGERVAVEGERHRPEPAFVERSRRRRMRWRPI